MDVCMYKATLLLPLLSLSANIFCCPFLFLFYFLPLFVIQGSFLFFFFLSFAERERKLCSFLSTGVIEKNDHDYKLMS